MDAQGAARSVGAKRPRREVKLLDVELQCQHGACMQRFMKSTSAYAYACSPACASIIDSMDKATAAAEPGATLPAAKARSSAAQDVGRALKRVVSAGNAPGRCIVAWKHGYATCTRAL
jgi:hypothetical protein